LLWVNVTRHNGPIKLFAETFAVTVAPGNTLYVLVELVVTAAPVSTAAQAPDTGRYSSMESVTDPVPADVT
jgi:hypothetical protein